MEDRSRTGLHEPPNRAARTTLRIEHTISMPVVVGGIGVGASTCGEDRERSAVDSLRRSAPNLQAHGLGWGIRGLRGGLHSVLWS